MKAQKRVTTHAVVKDDIERVLTHIQHAEQDDKLSKDRADQTEHSRLMRTRDAQLISAMQRCLHRICGKAYQRAA